jgi:hypothetical protein
MIRHLKIALITAAAAMCPFLTWADAIIVSRAMTASTIAEIFVEPERVRTELQIGLADLGAFQNLLPDKLYVDLGNPPKPRVERLRDFLEKDWVLYADGQQLQGRIVSAEPRKRVVRDELTGDPLPVQPHDAPLAVFVVLEHALPDRASVLSLRPPTDDKGDVSASIGFVLYHFGMAVNDFRYLVSEQTVGLDWEDPWYSNFRNRNLWRRYKSPMNGFIYVDGFEVRKEIIVRPKDLEEWIDLGLNGRQTIRVADQDALKSKVAEFLSQHHPVTIDGEPADMQLDRIHFVRRTLRQTGMIEPPEDLPVVSATLGVIFSQPVDRWPQEVTMRWDLFSDRIQKVPTVASDETSGPPWFLTPDDPVLAWKNFLTSYRVPEMEPVPLGPEWLLAVPVPAALLIVLALGAAGLALRPRLMPRGAWIGLSLAGFLCAGALSSRFVVEIENPFMGLPEEKKAAEIIGKLVGNLHSTMLLRDETRLQGAIGMHVSEAKVAEILPELRRAFAIVIQGGGSARVENIDSVVVRDIRKLANESGFQAQAEWSANARAGHWGHLHQRRMRFNALMELVPVERVWKLQGVTVLNIQQES